METVEQRLERKQRENQEKLANNEFLLAQLATNLNWARIYVKDVTPDGIVLDSGVRIEFDRFQILVHLLTPNVVSHSGAYHFGINELRKEHEDRTQALARCCENLKTFIETYERNDDQNGRELEEIMWSEKEEIMLK